LVFFVVSIFKQGFLSAASFSRIFADPLSLAASS